MSNSSSQRSKSQRLVADGCLKNVHLATFSRADACLDDYGSVPDGCLLWKDGMLVYAGAAGDAPDFEAFQIFDGYGCWATPGLIDCHTHLVYAGNRADEFEAVRNGKSYTEISREGGGILRTVKSTRAASMETLLSSAKDRLRDWIDQGVTTIEIKSGYGLTVDDEMKMLQVIKAISQSESLNVQATCLAAHTLPPEYVGQADRYLTLIIETLLPKIKQEQLASAIDVFCEKIAFTAKQSDRLLSAAQQLGFAVKGHVEQLSQQRGVDVLTRLKGLSADHVEYADSSQAEQMAAAGTCAVLLPGAFYYLNETVKPPIADFRKAGVTMAVATDHNPGSSPLSSILAAANMSSVLFGLTPAEALAGITVNAAKALGLDHKLGQLRTDFQADIALWNIEHPRQLIYEFRQHQPRKVFWRGQERKTC